MNDRIQLSVEPALRELLPGFLANRRKDVEVIGRALGSGNLEAIKVVGHNIRCFSRVYGFDELTALGEEIHRAAEQGRRQVSLRPQSQASRGRLSRPEAHGA